ncbi:helix-turn-helix domain containing protein [Microbacterium horticulturae]|uniref:Helix-turn-helix domain containing protein n=1 Tax=Microbacterium horticulturae TaxID=3028316 RepID=A0ABY8C1Z0_9MICO|nr:TetR/AcrR family transcriptional regulator [Microbacterium sp. KACC 23027]WEG09752.1 helix-turn-helix domain containing protein [Microbacterium sp. KACC 23027]
MNSPSRLRADARENRAELIRAARGAFAAEERPSLEAIARAAGVGIGTLYRHFPRREALVEAVYRDQVEELRAGAARLLGEQTPAMALRAWMELFADWADAKRGMVDTLAAMRQEGVVDLDASRREIEDIIATMLDAGARAHDVRSDIGATDVRSLLAGILAAGTDRAQVSTLFDLALDGLRAR